MIGTVCWLKSSWGCTLVHLCDLNFLTVWWLDSKNKCSERERKRDLGRSHISSYDLVLEDVQCFFCHILLFEEVTMFHSCSREGNMDSTTPWRNVKVTLHEVCVGWGIYWYHSLENTNCYRKKLLNIKIQENFPELKDMRFQLEKDH